MGLIGGFSCPLEVLWRHGDCLPKRFSQNPTKGGGDQRWGQRALDNRVGEGVGKKGGGYNTTAIEFHWPQ